MTKKQRLMERTAERSAAEVGEGRFLLNLEFSGREQTAKVKAAKELFDTGADDAAVRRLLDADDLDRLVPPIGSVGTWKPEEEDENVLVYGGPWLERGGSAWIVSTSGTGKSIHAMQLMHSFARGKPFSGLRPSKPLKIWYFQSEDSPRRIAQDRADVRDELDRDDAGADGGRMEWDEVSENIRYAKFPGKIGAAWIAALDEMLTKAENCGMAPDLIVINPFLAFVGGPITDGSYVTPFLRGGMVNGELTEGLQAVIERHRVGALIYHHTPKPPADKEVDAWMKSAFPEYQGAGSSDITNWGRSFITMMRVKDHRNMVCLTAGKNGGELGWQQVGGAFRLYLAYSVERGISGRGRHAWRELTEDEREEVVAAAQSAAEKAEAKKCEPFNAEACARVWSQQAKIHKIGTNDVREVIYNGIKDEGRTVVNARAATAELFEHPARYGLVVKCNQFGKKWLEPDGPAWDEEDA